MVGHAGTTSRAGMKRRVLSIVAACLALFAPHCIGEAAAVDWQQDEAIDRAAGILGRPWSHAIASMITADYLRLQSRIRAGLPSYDQQPQEALSPPGGTAPPPAAPAPVPAPVPAPTPAPTPTPTPTPEPPPVILKVKPAH